MVSIQQNTSRISLSWGMINSEVKKNSGFGLFSPRIDRCLDLLGFKQQLVFATQAWPFPFHPSSKKPSELGMVLQGS
ncbi:MAG: hypothetical protein Ct9H90mP27_6100 [Gammaproteobacteria bacterium]|nr:MAG: hypothetical protein Ct9H90mP27_6100 [Gammaproteobacteria bacterium]